MSQCFFLLVLKQVDAAVVVTILMTCMQKFVFLVCQELMKQDIQNGMKRVRVNVDQIAVFVIIKNVGIMINVGVNAKNELIEECVIKDLFGILVVVGVNVINHVIQNDYLEYENCKCRKNQLINQLMNVLKLLNK